MKMLNGIGMLIPEEVFNSIFVKCYHKTSLTPWGFYYNIYTQDPEGYIKDNSDNPGVSDEALEFKRLLRIETDRMDRENKLRLLQEALDV